jgi:hypothetical protein
MNGNSFSLIGYLSVLLWVGVPLLWLIRKRSRWACISALVLALLAFVFAKINSENHVNRIAPDVSQQMQSASELAEKRRRAVEKDRGDDVADIRFAEDGSGDFLDKAGMDEADLKYMGKLESETEPEWKKTKKTRSGAGDRDGSLDDMIGGDEAISSVNAEALENKEEKPPILMSDADMAMAQRLDSINHTVIKSLILLGLLMLVVDYLGRANVYATAFMPLPLPSAWLNAMAKIPPLFARPVQARRDVQGELSWLASRGDCFLLLTDDAATAQAVPDSLPRLGTFLQPLDVLRVSGDKINDDFIVEGLWYGRASFVIDSAERAAIFLSRFQELLELRKKNRAHTRQTFHLVWDLSQPLTENQFLVLERLARATGFSLFIMRSSHSS